MFLCIIESKSKMEMNDGIRTHLFSLNLLGGLSGGWHWRDLGGILIGLGQIAFLLALLFGLFALGRGLPEALQLLFLGTLALGSQHVRDEVEDQIALQPEDGEQHEAALDLRHVVDSVEQCEEGQHHCGEAGQDEHGVVNQPQSGELFILVENVNQLECVSDELAEVVQRQQYQSDALESQEVRSSNQEESAQSMLNLGFLFVLLDLLEIQLG